MQTSSRHRQLLMVSLFFVLTSCHEGPTDECSGERWVGAWAAAPSDEGSHYADQSLRLIVSPLRAGSAVRVRLSNRFGLAPVTFQNVHLGKQASGAALVAGSNRPVLFAGSTEVTVASGEEVQSDPLDFPFAAFDRLAVSVYVPMPGGATQHAEARQTSFYTDAGAGNLADREAADGFVNTMTTRPFVVGLDVRTAAHESVIVAIGDSITDGVQTAADGTPHDVDTDTRYPDFLARRLDPNAGLSVINLGIGGNRILDDGFVPAGGLSLSSRLERDVLARSDVTDVIILEGINDLGFRSDLTPDALIQGIEDAVRALKAQRPGRPVLNVLVGTILPAGGTTGITGAIFGGTEDRRQLVNARIRSPGIGDGYVDFDAALRDPADPTRLAASYDGGDGLHPSTAGYSRMADEVNLALLRGRRCR